MKIWNRRPGLLSFSSVAVVLALLPLCFLFQNCSQVHFLTQNSTVDSKTQDNGAGYGGKPTGQFYRFTPDFTCENKESSVMNLKVSTNQAVLTENKKLKCGAVTQNLDANLIDSSIFQNDLVGYQEGIFEGELSVPTSIPANLVEVWCRDSAGETGIETVTHFDRTTKIAMNRTYFSKSDSNGSFQHQMVGDFQVARLISKQTVTIRTDNDFELTVQRDQPALQLGLFNGHLKAVIEGKTVERDTFCRLGGNLDPQVWPAKQIVDMNVRFMKPSPNKNYFSYSSDTGTPNLGMGFLYTSRMDGSGQTKISEGLSWANGNFQYSSDSAKLLYMNDGPGSDPNHPKDLWIVRSDGTGNTLVNSQSSLSSVYSMTGDSQYLVFNSGSITEPWLKSISLQTGATVDLNPVLTAQAFGQFVPNAQNIVVDNFGLSPVSNKVAFLCCNSPTELYTTNADGSQLTKIPLPIPSDFKLLGVQFVSPGYDKMLQVLAWSLASGTQRYLTFAVSPDGSSAFKLPDDWIWNQTSPSGDFGSFSHADQGRLINLKTGQSYDFPPSMGINASAFASNSGYESLFFTRDSSAFVGNIPDLSSPAGEKKLVSISTADGRVTELCPGIPSGSVRELANNTFAMVSSPANSHVLNIYLASATQSCRLVNSIPVTPGAGNQIHVFAKLSPDQNSVLVRRQLMQASDPAASLTKAQSSEDLLFYIPLDGRPSLLINSPVFRAASLSSFDFTLDSKSVIYLGDQVRPSETNVFTWQAPY